MTSTLRIAAGGMGRNYAWADFIGDGERRLPVGGIRRDLFDRFFSMGWVKREKYECNIVIFYATFGAVERQTKYRVMRSPPENFMDLVLGE